MLISSTVKLPRNFLTVKTATVLKLGSAAAVVNGAPALERAFSLQVRLSIGFIRPHNFVSRGHRAALPALSKDLGGRCCANERSTDFDISCALSRSGTRS